MGCGSSARPLCIRASFLDGADTAGWHHHPRALCGRPGAAAGVGRDVAAAVLAAGDPHLRKVGKRGGVTRHGASPPWTTPAKQMDCLGGGKSKGDDRYLAAAAAVAGSARRAATRPPRPVS